MHVEEASKFFGESQKRMDDKIDGIFRLMQQSSSPSEMGGAEKDA
jgi:hypothetical protein